MQEVSSGSGGNPGKPKVRQERRHARAEHGPVLRPRPREARPP